jgi:hypothetical protein
MTTDRYVKAAESFDVKGIGEPFPALPASLLVRIGPAEWTRTNEKSGFRRGWLRGGEPHGFYFGR